MDVPGVKPFLNLVRKQLGNDTVHWYRGGLPIIDEHEANQKIRDALLEDKPYMVARFGSTEIKPTLYYSVLRHNSFIRNLRHYVKGDIDYIFDSDSYQDYMVRIMCKNSGFFPEDASLLQNFSKMMIQDTELIDMCGCWLNEKLLLPFFNSKSEFCYLGALEPYDYDIPWTLSLKGKTVLVIHPFEASIISQYNRKDTIWGDKMILPDFELKTIKAVQSLAFETTRFADWFQALDSMKCQIDETEFDVALIGCGAYGLPLSAHVKRLGKKAIHLGGPLQILFGIKGSRWDQIPSVSKYYNEYWVRPLENESLHDNSIVENGCYW